MNRKATDLLEEEHRYIQRVVGVMTILAEALETGKKVKAATLQNIIEFMRVFGDACHHGKEETCLFALLEKKGVPAHGCPLGALLHEHETGRALVKALAKDTEAYAKGRPRAKAALVKNLRALADLYPHHIWKEDYLLFPMTNKILNLKEQKQLLKRFERANQRIGKRGHSRSEQLVEKLEKEAQEL